MGVISGVLALDRVFPGYIVVISGGLALCRGYLGLLRGF